MTERAEQTAKPLESPEAGALELAAVAMVLVTAGIHLWWGLPRFINYASVGVMPDPRPLLFVLSGHAIAIGVTLVALGVIAAKRTYLPGIGLMLAHIIGYIAWHTVYNHGIEESHSHATEILHADHLGIVIIDHLVNSPIALISKSAEAAVIVLLAALYVSSNHR